MNRHTQSLLLVFLLLALSMVYAELIPWRTCPYPDSDAVSNCTIHEVYLDPCKEAPEEKPCKVKRGITANMTFTYTPAFSSDKMNVRIFWASQVMDIPFVGMNPDACLSTACPVTAGQKHTYHADVPILKRYPIRTYDIKWKIWGEQEQECCFMFQIKILK